MLARLQERNDRRAELLDAAMALVADQGVEALSVDAVARSCGLPKLRVLGHFPTTADLITAAIDHSCTRFDKAIEETAAAFRGPGRWLRAYVLASLWEFTRNDAAAIALFAILPPDDPRSKAYERHARRWRERALNDDIDPGTAFVVKFAADAVWFERLYGTIPEPDIDLIRKRLLRMLDEEAAAKAA